MALLRASHGGFVTHTGNPTGNDASVSRRRTRGSAGSRSYARKSRQSSIASRKRTSRFDPAKGSTNRASGNPAAPAQSRNAGCRKGFAVV